MPILSSGALIFIILVTLARLPEIVPFLVPFQLGKISLALGLLLVLADDPRKLIAVFHTPFGKWLGVILGLAFVGIPFSVWKGGALEGFLLYLKTMMTLCIIVGLSVGREHILRLACTLAVLLLALLMVLDKGTGRLQVSSTYDPNDIALLFVVFLPLVVSEALAGPRWLRLVSWLGAGCAIMGIALTQSRGGVLALGLVAVHAVLRVRGKRWLLLPLLAVGAAVFYTTADSALWERFQDLTDESDYNFTAKTGRMAMWEEGLGLMARNPLLGVGIMQFTAGMGMVGSGVYKAAHNSFIEIGAELGVFGLFAFLGLLWTVRATALNGLRSPALSRQDKIGRGALLLGLTGYCAGGFLLSQAYGNILYAFLALAAVMSIQQTRLVAAPAVPAPAPPEHVSSRARRPHVGAADSAAAVRRSREDRLSRGDRLRQAAQGKNS